MFGRSNRSAPPTVEPTTAPDKDGGKGRPTPKRREAERGRRRAVAAPKGRKEAYRRTRERQRETRKETIAGLRAGDERHFPPRDRGRVRRYARDVVDARRSVAEFFLPLALVTLVLTLWSDPAVKQAGSTLWIVLVVLMIVDSFVLSFRLRRGLRRALPGESTRGAIPYALMRSMQIRRMRVPPARVKPGGRPASH